MSKNEMNVKSRQARKLLDDIAEEGRDGDSLLAHVAKGEVVIPVALTTNAEFKALLDKAFAGVGLDIDEYTVGHEKNSINPETGLPEFSLRKRLKKFAVGLIGGALGFLLAGPGGAAKGAMLGAGVGSAAQMAYEGARAVETAQTAQAQNIAQAQEQAAQVQAQMQEQTKAQQAAAETAKARLQAEQAKYAEEKATADKVAADLAAKVEEERRISGQKASAAMRARTRGGRRALLSEARLNPEVGVLGGGNTLGGM